uniref:protein-tyrosine-phosphatase n=1 Tax=Globodera rostochiensis TaxID=31243 RepID=A0A914I7R0_GLORO
MPLKLKLGRTSGRYELSEDIYILTILVGDQTIAQCTLTSHSTSADVFRFLAEKHCIKQPELFGLQYQMKATDTEKRMMRWVEPDKSIRRQLERWACRRGQKWAVNLAILHACANVFTLHDTVSRSVYYTLLKLDVLQDSKFATLELEKCINLAAYQLQIEFPNLNSPTLQHLKMLALLPQNMCRNPKFNNDETYAKILSAYEKLHTMQPAYAALLYIVEIQQCDGYGEELFQCKDGSSLEEVSLGYSLDFIFVRRPNGTGHKFRWDEVREIMANKRKVTIKCGDAGALVVFGFEDNEMARYVSTVLGWKWRHARVDAQQQKAARLSVQNLQGGMPSFSLLGSQLRRSTGNVNSVRPSSELNIGTANGGNAAGNGNAFLAPYAMVPSTSQPARTDSSSQSTVHSAQSCCVRPPVNVCCRSVSMGQVSAAVSVANAFLHPAHIPSPDKMSPTAPQLAVATTTAPTTITTTLAPLTAQTQQQQQTRQTSNSSQDSDWLRHEQREVLKKMLTEKRRLNKIGSSPEINTVGLSKGAAVAKCKRQQQQQHNGNAPGTPGPKNGSGRRLGGFALARKIFSSTPNLNSTTGGAGGGCRHQHQNQIVPAGNNGGVPLAASPLVPATSRIIQQHAITVPSTQAPPLPYYSPPPLHIHPTLHPNAFFVQQNGGGIPPPQLPSAPPPPLSALFSQGQLIDENGQQRAVIYPIPPEASPLIRPSNSPPALIGGGDENISRSSPKSNGTSSHSEAPLCVQSSLGSDGSAQQTKNYSVAVRAHNLHRNRGSKIYPYNDSRARLTATKANPDGYINASLLNVPVGKHTQLRYVVSQAPIAKTIEDFWQLVWETNARLIVMLVNPHQITKDDTVPSYIPKQAKEKLTVGEFFLRLKSVSPPMQMQFQSTTSFTLSKRGEARRTIWHLYCADFSEQGVPSSMETFIGLVDAVTSVKRHIENEAKRAAEQQRQQQSLVTKTNSNASKESSRSSSDASKRDRAQSAISENGWTKKLRFESSGNDVGKEQKQQQQSYSASSSSSAESKTMREEPLTIIQCTDGSSESGLYLLAEVVIRCMESNAPFDIAQLLRDLRYQRMCLVKNASQYKFVYELASFYERKLRLV